MTWVWQERGSPRCGLVSPFEGSVSLSMGANVREVRPADSGMYVRHAVGVTQGESAPGGAVLPLPIDPPLKVRLGKATSPIVLVELGKWLGWYPDKGAAEFLWNGFNVGFILPVTGVVQTGTPRNLKSATELPMVVHEKVCKEVSLGRMCGPFSVPPLQDLVLSPVGVVPKKEVGKFRLIQHLSRPQGTSVNDAIAESECSVGYQSFEDALALVQGCGAGALLAKLDIEFAFRLLPLHPSSFRYMGFRLSDGYYVDKCLPMGCSVSYAFFECFSTFLHWSVVAGSGHQSVAHYLDNFLFISPVGTTVCQYLLFSAQALFRVMGVPVAADKSEGPTVRLSYLGIEIDTVAGCCRLPAEKVAKLRGVNDTVQSECKVQLRQVQSLLGLFNFACRVIPMGRVFCRKLEMATVGVTKAKHFVRMSKEIRDDLAMWRLFLESFNGVCLWSLPGANSVEL
ncbi:uncharacterized protein LOC142107921 [Mixophyes fleayi]|uniref:uncharacterized protein LOC142107921 n=1 Tax=Mixophyes fleayi TaxID=3061075 RepID=UPI003F4DBE74